MGSASKHCEEQMNKPNDNQSDSKSIIMLEGRRNGNGQMVYSALEPQQGRGGWPYEEDFYKTRGVPGPYPRHEVGRTLTPESLMGDKCALPAGIACDKSRLVSPFMSDVSDPYLTAQTMDYNAVGTIGQARVAFRRMFADEFQDVSRTPMVLAGNDFNATFANYPTTGAAIGFVIDWGVTQLNFSPFDMQIVSTGWTNAAGTPIDRNLTLRVYRVNGSAVYVPFAQRTSPSMSMAQMQVARANVQEGSATISVIDLPANVAAFFSATVMLLSAFSPRTAAYSSLEYVMSDE
jgi:hypothetical protein